MATELDPYYEWLGIPPAEQPADHYRLLGVALFESNLNAISNASDARMGYVRTFQAGPRGKESQQLLNELSAARGCLLNPDRRSEYDTELRRNLQAKAVVSKPLPAAKPLVVTAVLPQPIPQSSFDWQAPAVELPQISTPRPTASSGAPVPVLAIVGGLAALLLVVGVVAGTSMLRSTPPTSVATGPVKPQTEAAPPTPPVATPPSPPAVSRPIPPVVRPPSPPAATPSSPPTPPVVQPSLPMAEPKTPEPKSEPTPVAEPPAEKTDPPPTTSQPPEVPPPAPIPSEAPQPPEIPASQGAVLAIKNMTATPVPAVQQSKMPSELRPAVAYWFTKRVSASEQHACVEIRVEQEGWLYLAPTWDLEGNQSWNWREEQMLEKEILGLGFEKVGKCEWRTEHNYTLFKKLVKKGDEYRIRTNKYWPPLIYARANAADNIASAAGAEKTSSTTVTKTSPPAKKPAELLAAKGTIFPAVQVIPGGVSGGGKQLTEAWEFVAKADIIVTHLGLYDERRDGFKTEHDLAIWDLENKEEPLVTTHIEAGANLPLDGFIRYQPVKPVELKAEGSYVLAAYYPESGDNVVSMINPTGLTITYAPHIEPMGRRYILSKELRFPVNLTEGGRHAPIGPSLIYKVLAGKK